ncbi:ATP-NAD kinase-like domain-containing protein [Xylogone sp. PMI_703]|nr:ATP-NAD kinase-like domain-containing protein [Xylogone sp. PMI_703]
MPEEDIRHEDVIIITAAEDDGWIEYSLIEEEGAPANGKSPFKLTSTNHDNLSAETLSKHTTNWEGGIPPQLKPDQNRIHVLISTRSGTGQALSFFETVLEPVLQAVGLQRKDYSVIQTENANSVTEFTKNTLLPSAEKGEKQTLILLSGDGGVAEIINTLMEKTDRSSNYVKPVISQLPFGTGNALYHSNHRVLPGDEPIRGVTSKSIYTQALRTVLFGEPKPLPIFKASFSPGARLLSDEGRSATPIHNSSLYGAVVASYGLHSTLVADSDTTEYRKHGDKRFGLVANDLLFPGDGSLPHAYKAQVSLFKSKGPNPVVLPSLEHGYILAALVSSMEKTFTISPANRPLDGQLRLVHFGATSGKQAMEIMMKAYDAGKHVDMEWEESNGVKQKVDYEEIDGLRIDFKEEGESWKWRRCCIDGLIVGIEEGGWAEIRTVERGSEALDVVVEAAK